MTTQKLGNAELALAYELRESGCELWLVADALGVSDTHLEQVLRFKTRHGLVPFYPRSARRPRHTSGATA